MPNISRNSTFLSVAADHHDGSKVGVDTQQVHMVEVDDPATLEGNAFEILHKDERYVWGVEYDLKIINWYESPFLISVRFFSVFICKIEDTF